MKKGRISKIISIGLAFALTFTGNVSMFAAENEIIEESVSEDSLFIEEEPLADQIEEGILEETEITNLSDDTSAVIADGEEKIEFTEEMISFIPNQVYTSFQIKPTIKVGYGRGYLVENRDFIVNYSNNVNVGRAKVVVSGIGRYKGSVPITVGFNIVKRDVNTLSINGLTDEEGRSIEYFYTGSKITPIKMICHDDLGNEKDVTDDLNIEYASNLEAGMARATITGKGNYIGKKIIEFDIQQTDINDSAIKINYVVNNLMTIVYNYVHKEIEPSLDIYNTLDGKRTELVKNRDYLIEYEFNSQPGRAKITLTGKGNYTGERVVYFDIVKKNIEDLDIEYKNFEYTGEKIEPVVVIRDGEYVLRNTLDYNIVYENNRDVGEGIIKISTPTISAYTGTVEKTFTISRKNLSNAVLEDVSNFTYISGSNPVFTQDSMIVKLDGKILTKDVDYTLSYTNNRASTTQDVTATVKVTGINNYLGTLSATYTISPYGGASVSGRKRLDDFTDTNWDVSLLTNGLSAKEIIYDGKEKRPAVTVKYMGKVLVENEDYTLSYHNNTNIGTAYVQIKARNDSKYVGCRNEYFYIIGRPINGEGTVEGGFSVKVPEEVTYSGKMCEPEVNIKYLGSRLVEGRDYELTYYNNGHVTDNARVVITGIGNYSKSLTFTFSILPLDLSKVYNEKVGSRTYTGYDICPDVFLKTGKKKSDNKILSSDYNLEYRDNRNAGTAVIICTPANDNIVGSKEITFKITKKKIDQLVINSDIKGIYRSYVAEGDQICPEFSISYNGLEVVQMGSDTLGGLSDVAIIYGTNTNPGKGSITIKATPKKNGGTDNFTGNKKIKFEITGRDFVVENTLPSMQVPYNPKYEKPSIVELRIKDKETGEELLENIDYKVKYIKPIHGLDYGEILFIGRGLYKTKTVSFKYDIIPMDVDSEELVIGEIKDIKYTGAKLKPIPSVRVNNRPLKKGIDYIITYKNNIRPGTATAEILFIGNYSGSTEVTFNIV